MQEKNQDLIPSLKSTCLTKKTFQKCETALASQFDSLEEEKSLKKVENGGSFFYLKKSKEKLEDKNWKIQIFSSAYHSDQMSEGSQVSEVTICVKILKWG